MKKRNIIQLVMITVLIFISASVSAQKNISNDSIIVLKNVRIVDGTGALIKHDQTLIIKGGEIGALGKTSQVSIPSGAKIIDLAGYTVFPGLVMMHEHFEYREGQDFSHAQPVSYPRLFLAFGVTTVRTAGTDHPYVNINLKKAIDEGRVPGPEMHLTSPYINGEGERFHRNTFLGDAKVRTPEDATRVVRYWAAEGMTSFKVYFGLPKDAMATIIKEAHRLKLTVTGHLRDVGCSEAADLGIDNIEHGFLCGNDLIDSTGKQIEGADNPIVQALIKKLVNKKVAITLTPNQRLSLFSDLELEVMHPHIREKYQKMKQDDPYLKSISGLTRAKAFARAGGVLLLGSDAAGNGRIAGFTNIRGIKLMVTGGFTLEETIRIASLNGATFLGIQHRTGSIAIGKEADLFIVKGDPSKTIDDIENVEMVFSNGIMYDPKVLIAAAKGLVGWQ